MEKSKLSALVQELTWEQNYWSQLHKKGAKDPFGRDGSRINMCRERIIAARKKIKAFCDAHGESLPMDYYTPVPPKAPAGYAGPGSTGTAAGADDFWEPKKDKSKRPLPIMDQGSLF